LNIDSNGYQKKTKNKKNKKHKKRFKTTKNPGAKNVFLHLYHG